MSDLRELLHDAAPAQDLTVSHALVEADVVRARRALRRRRAGRLSGATGLVAAAAVGALALAGPGASPSGPAGGGATSAPQSGADVVELVAYTGKQPSGYRLDKVPAGWEIRDSNASVLTLAPRGSAEAAPVEGATSLVGTIAISTQNDTGVPSGVRLDDVRVDGQEAVIAHMKGAGDTRTLFAQQPDGSYLVIQVWDGLGWDNARIAEFAASVSVTDDAERSVG